MGRNPKGLDPTHFCFMPESPSETKLGIRSALKPHPRSCTILFLLGRDSGKEEMEEVILPAFKEPANQKKLASYLAVIGIKLKSSERSQGNEENKYFCKIKWRTAL